MTEHILGKIVDAPTNYDPSILVREPRSSNRDQYGIDGDDLPFCGYDVWNAYEVAFLTENGFPASFIMKMVYPASSKYIVESKSLKLYLNSFNMEVASGEHIRRTIITDLERLLACHVRVSLGADIVPNPFENFMKPTSEHFKAVQFHSDNENPDLLSTTTFLSPAALNIQTDVLRSNCKITHQPDWGDCFILMKGISLPRLSSLMQYLISFRNENHFHEEVVEMIFKRLYDKFHPDELMVCAMYVRRGGIDINPIRATSEELIPKAFSYENTRIQKTARQ